MTSVAEQLVSLVGGPPLKVMVVDDTYVNRQIFQVFLERLGFVCVMAEDGDDAIAMFTREQPDIVLMDVMMPNLNGYEATRRIRQASGDRWVPVIFVSALDREENLIDGLEAGGDDFMSKPVNFVILDAKMRSLRRMVQMQRHLDAVRRRSNAITENIVDGVVTIDDHGKIQSVNPAARRIFGYDESELVGHDIAVLLPESKELGYVTYLSRYFDGDQHFGMVRELTAKRKNGDTFDMELGVSEIRLPDQHLFVGVFRDISERKRVEQHLRDYRDFQEREHALTREIIERQMARPGLLDHNIHYWVVPAVDFSGDIVAAARSRDGRLFALLADGAGHGLAAAVSALPVLTVFYSMVERAADLQQIAAELNTQLRASLPVGRFVAATIACIDEKRGSADLWMGGMPVTLWLDSKGRVKRRLTSTHVPLGIVDLDQDMLTLAHIDWARGDRLLMCSDGLLESHTTAGEAFGVERYVSIVESCGSGTDLLTHIQDELVRHIGSSVPHDDISILMIGDGHGAAV